jgi:hypothetical protein
MRQEVGIRYIVTSLERSAQHLYENVSRPPNLQGPFRLRRNKEAHEAHGA